MEERNLHPHSQTPQTYYGEIGNNSNLMDVAKENNLMTNVFNTKYECNSRFGPSEEQQYGS